MRPMKSIALASLNKGKQEEFRALFEKHQMNLVSLDEFVRNYTFLEKVEKDEPSSTYYDNAFRKCKAAFMAAKVPTLADDSGIEIDALKGAPGVHSAHFAKPSARESQGQANRTKILTELKGKSNRKAKMRCVLVFMVEGVHLKAEGVCEGTIAEKESGAKGFGYDSIFLPDGAGGKTFAELTQEEKNRLSHRALAVDDLVRLLKEREIEFVRP
jgi:XTP/dITP diphosphohydrolase